MPILRSRVSAKQDEISIFEKLEKEMRTNMSYENDQVTQAMEANFA
jgi:hypothetical protein